MREALAERTSGTTVVDHSVTASAIEAESQHVAHNYHPLPVVVAEAEGSWMTDVEGRRLFDALSGYSALNFGHRHPRLVAAAHAQLDRVTLTSRAFHHDQLGTLAAELSALAGKDMVLPMNTGAEAVETAVKMSRRWGHEVKGIGSPRIIVMGGNFHGRTTTIVSFSDDPEARDGYGPYTPGFTTVPFGDATALAAAMGPDVCAVLFEPIQGESGVVIPPAGWLAEVRRLCTEHGALMIADEIQSGLGRTGTTFACELWGVVPDAYILGKALGGGIVPISAVVADADVLGVFSPGSHGSTFGGNPLACAVATEVVRMLATGEHQARARELGVVLHDRLAAMPVAGFRSVGLWAGVDVVGRTGRAVCEDLLTRGVLAKDTHGSTIRLAPPLTTSREDLDWALSQLEQSV